VFRPETTIRLQTNHFVSTTLGLLASVVVFLPVLWTWLSFRSASLAYRDIVLNRQWAGESFLQLWASGFHGTLPTHYWLHNVAMGSAVLIGMSVLLVLLEHISSRISSANEQRQWEFCAAQLAECLTYAQVTIGRLNTSDPVEGIAELSEAARELVSAHAIIEQSIQTLDAMEQAVASSAANQQALVDAANAIAETTRILGTKLTRHLNGSTLKLNQAIRSLKNEVENMKHDTDTITESLGDHARAVQCQITELSQVRQHLDTLVQVSAASNPGFSQ